MDSNVEPAELPLPGGQANATIVLHPLSCGEVPMPEGWVHGQPGLMGALGAFGIAGPSRRPLRAPVVAFLLEHPSAGVVLVDTGFSADVMTNALRTIGAVNARVFSGVRVQRDETIAAQLAGRGIEPGDVSLIVMTHLHVDHASALRDFPKATVLVTEPEWHAAGAPTGALNGYHRPNLHSALTYRLLHHPEPPAPGIDRLGQALDLFGDGSIRLLSTPGHSAGHQSLIVRLEDREALIAGDAVYTLANLREGVKPWRMPDREAYEQSVRTLAAYDRANPDALIVPGHDMALWETLDDSYS